MKSIQLKKWLVALDRSEMDQRIIQNVKFWARLLKPEHIDIIHVQLKQSDLEDLDQHLFEKIIENDREDNKRWEQELSNAFKDLKLNIKVRTHYGNSLIELKTISAQENYDLVVCGKKQSTPSTEQLTESLAKEIQASFLLIPETALPQCKKILVPTDCSNHASLALQTAKQIKEAKPDTKITVTRIYEVPSGYHYIGHSFEEASYNMAQNAQKKVHTQLEKLGMKADELKVELKTQHSNAEHIQKIACDGYADLIIAGSKGITASAHMLMGTTASRMMRHVGRAPLLIIKKKGETLDFLGALGKLMNPE